VRSGPVWRGAISPPCVISLGCEQLGSGAGWHGPGAVGTELYGTVDLCHDLSMQVEQSSKTYNFTVLKYTIK
jgi:hypothetical protein